MGQCSCDKQSSTNPQYQANTNYDPINYNNNNNYNNNIKYDYNLYKEKYMSPINNEEKPFINIRINDNTKINDLNKLKWHYDDIKIKNKFFYDDIEEQESYINNYKEFIIELNYQINNLKDKLNISLVTEKNLENLLEKDENNELLNNLDNISNKINKFYYLIEKQKTELKYLENNFQIIQEQFNEIKKNQQINQDNILSTDIQYIKAQLNQSEIIINKLNQNKKLYDQKKLEIENDINNIQNKTEKKITSIKIKRKNTLKKYNLNKNYNDGYNEINDSLFLKGSMLCGIKDFGKAENIFKSMYIFNNKEEINDNYEKQKLIKKNWHETCYIYDDYDKHDINYELKAVGLPDQMAFTSSSFGFTIDTNIEIISFEINGNKADYEYANYFLRFKIKLKNFESINIHIIYKESPLYEKMTEGQKAIRNFYRVKYYGISKRLVGQNAKYILINLSNFEIIHFEEELFLKKEIKGNNNNEYHWGGKVPENGKETIVRLSKKEAKVNFYEKHVIKSIDNSFIQNTVTKIPFCYMNGNNKIINYNYRSAQTNRIKLDQNKKVFEIEYINTNSPIVEFTIKGELINKCKGDWIIKLTNEEIESLIPPDFKTNKEHFKRISKEIINNYDIEHKDDLTIVPNVTKIGKWVKKNIKYDITYVGLNDITATEIYNLRKGVCHHITKLFNAFMYSLGYQVLYILGYAVDKKINFSIEDAHAWSLINIEGKWLPFDATWGIFSGKLPVTHVFKLTDCEGIQTLSYDRVKIEQIDVKGNIN